MTDISVPLGLELEAIVNGDARAVAFSLWGGLTRLTPVGNTSLWKTPNPPSDYVGGRARSNWFLSVGAPNRTTTTDTEPTKAQQVMVAVIKSAESIEYPTITLSNNLPYIVPLNNGHSSQAPKKFIDTEIIRVTNASNLNG